MSKGYLIAHLKEHDQEGMDKFKQMSGPTIGEHGGKVLGLIRLIEIQQIPNL